jgi:hypothetical protein
VRLDAAGALVVGMGMPVGKKGQERIGGLEKLEGMVPWKDW